MKKSNATYSSIVAIGERIKEEEKKGEKFLPLHRGVNMVVPIKLSQVNNDTKEFQQYAPNQGRLELRSLIQKEYFPTGSIDNITITAGGMGALDFTFQILDVKVIWLPKFYWGSYGKIAKIRGVEIKFYEDYPNINHDEAILICDPSNPTGRKVSDEIILNYSRDCKGTVIFDSPYRRLFYRDDFFDKIAQYNVIICESFSKWIGLSGLRVGFIYSNNEEFNKELQIRVLYQYNGVSTASQLQVESVLQDDVAISQFRAKTTHAIYENIKYLEDRKMLADIYTTRPIGIFVVLNIPFDKLFVNKIGSVSMDKFVNEKGWSDYSRICVSVPHDEFKKYFDKL